MSSGHCALCVGAWLIAFWVSGPEQQDQKPPADRAQGEAGKKKAERAAAMLRHDIGTWDCEWTYLDAQGEPTRSVKGTEVMTYGLNGKIVEMTTSVPADKIVSRSMRFYNTVTQKITVLSVGSDGNYWEMFQDADSDVMVSAPHPTPRGGTEHVRFTTTNKSENTMEVEMELSRDGRTWRKIFVQKMTRRKATARKSED